MEVRKALQEYDGTLRELTRQAGVSHSTLIDLRDGRSENPGIRTVEKINAALKRLRLHRESITNPSSNQGVPDPAPSAADSREPVTASSEVA